jgi:hypothetical protein
VIFCIGRDPRPVDALQNRTANGAHLTVLDDLSFRLKEQRRQASYSLGGVVLSVSFSSPAAWFPIWGL